MTRYLFYYNRSSETHVFERCKKIGDKPEQVDRLVSDPNEPDWNAQLSAAHALFRMGGMINDGQALTKMESDLDLLFERCKENEESED